MPVVSHFADSPVVFVSITAKCDLLPWGNAAFGEGKGRHPLLMLLVNFLSQRLILLLGGGGFSFLQSMTKAVDFRNGIQNGIGILRGHGVEFPNPALAVHLFCRA